MAPIIVFHDRRHDEGDAPPVGRGPRLADAGELVVIRGLEGTGGRLGGQAVRRTGGQKASRDEGRQPAGFHAMLKRLRDGENYALGPTDATGGQQMPTARPPDRPTPAVRAACAAPPAGSAPGPRPWCWERLIRSPRTPSRPSARGTHPCAPGTPAPKRPGPA